jgi:C_GCAxxG_C_C family probable redox protein
MSQRKVVCERAVAYFLGNYNCAQSVLLTMFEHWNGRNDLIPKIATAFGSGMGRCGSVCGALTGGMMALGIKFGTNEPSMEKRTETYELARKLFRRFEEENGSVLCRKLIGYDLSDPKQLQEARERDVFEEKCTVFISKAVETLLELTENRD